MVTDYTPTVEEVAQLIPSRAAGRFTGGATTTPAFPDQPRVQAVINDAVGLIAAAVGGDELDPLFYPGARALVKIQAAVLLEPSAWPEQARPDKSAFAQWIEMLKTSKEDLVAAIVRFRDDEEEGPGSSQQITGSLPAPGLANGTPLTTGTTLGQDECFGFPAPTVEW